MYLKRRQFTRAFKLQVIYEVEAGKSIAQAARQYQLHPNLITRTAHRQYAERAFAGNGNPYRDEARLAELERLVGQLTMENALLNLLRLEGQLRRGIRSGGAICFPGVYALAPAA